MSLRLEISVDEGDSEHEVYVLYSLRSIPTVKLSTATDITLELKHHPPY